MMVHLAGGGEVLQPGDHVYMWCMLYQHHGIVLPRKASSTATGDDEIDDDDHDDDNDDDNDGILIAEFTNAALAGDDNLGSFTSSSTASQAVSGEGVSGGFRIVLEGESTRWHKVKYNANSIECLTWRPGTCSAAQPSPVETILTRVSFLRQCRHWIPDYHVLASNCETVAVWCMTGTWQTLQGDRAMQLGAISSTALLVPALPLVGIAVSGLAIWHSRQIGKKWEDTAEKLNKDFEWYAMGKALEFDFEPTAA